MEKKILNDLLNYYHISDAIVCGDSSETISVKLNGEEFQGFSSAALSLYCSSIAKPLQLFTPDLGIIHHWLSFCSNDCFHCSSMQDVELCLKYINDELLNRPYLCGIFETVADVVLYFTFQPFIKQWSYHQKEQYINISRWFKSLEVLKTLENSKSKISFSKTLLYEDLVMLNIS